MIDTILSLNPIIQTAIIAGAVLSLPYLAGAVDYVKGQPRDDDGDFAPMRKTRVKQFYYAVGAGALAAGLVALTV